MVRPLICAESANPEWTSVPLIGWSHARAIQSRSGGLIVTQVRNRAAFIRAGAREGVDFEVIDNELSATAMWKIGKAASGGNGRGWTALMASSIIPYYTYEREVWKRFSKSIRAGKFDLVHRITPLSPTVPSSMAKKCEDSGVPFVIGPLNGGIPWPAQFSEYRHREREWLSYLRVLHRMLPCYRKTRANASAIICGSWSTFRQMPSWCRERCFYVPENGIDPDRFTRLRTRSASIPLRCIFIGRLVPYKGCDMLLEAAVPLIRDGLVQIEIVGDGPEMASLQSLVKRRQICRGVNFAGWIDHNKVQEYLSKSDILVFPSVREFGGGVILEAMAIGVPPMAVAYGGPGELMTSATSFPIEIGTRYAIIGRIREQLRKLVDNPVEIDFKGKAAISHARLEYSWDVKSNRIAEIYRWAIGDSVATPCCHIMNMEK